jgi:hypothetical protein
VEASDLVKDVTGMPAPIPNLDPSEGHQGGSPEVEP